MASTEGIPCFILFVHGFTLPIKLSLSQLKSFLSFILQILPPHPGVGEWISAFVWLSELLRVNAQQCSNQIILDGGLSV